MTLHPYLCRLAIVGLLAMTTGQLALATHLAAADHESVHTCKVCVSLYRLGDALTSAERSVARNVLPSERPADERVTPGLLARPASRARAPPVA